MLLISGPHTYNLSWGTLLQIYVSIYRCSIGNFMLCIATLLQMHMCIYVWLTCVVFISYRLGHSNRSIDVRLPNGSMLAPSKVVLMGPLSRSTINHLVYRELQPSICAVSQLECWPLAPLRAWVSSTHVRGCISMLSHGGNAGRAALTQSLPTALAALAASPFLIGGM